LATDLSRRIMKYIRACAKSAVHFKVIPESPAAIGYARTPRY